LSKRRACYAYKRFLLLKDGLLNDVGSLVVRLTLLFKIIS